jgi:protein-tyrosine phosphatase
MNILMVCLGNICRSPLADGLLRKKVSDNKLNVEVDSAGTSGIHSGEAPDARMCQTAKKFGTPIDELRSRKFVIEDFDNFDKIYVMDKSNKANILQMARNEEDKKKVELILNMSFPLQNKEVPDPYYGGEEGFIEVYHLLDAATDRIIEKIKNNEL